MDLNDIKIYLTNRPFPVVIPADEELEKFYNYAQLILKTFYDVAEFTDEFIQPVGEEVAFLLENDPFEDVYKMYNYLKKFSIGNGAVTGEVFEKTIGMLSPFVKNLMSALGYEILQSSDGKAYYTYAIF